MKTLILWLGLLVTTAAGAAPNILVTGDSLSAAYGMPLEQGWVALLQQRLKAEGYPHQVRNTSISGETSAAALGRLEAELTRYQPAIVIIELGANDGLRGLPLGALQKNLQQMVKLSQKASAKVLLLGMRLPTNYGEVYTEKFHQVFHAVAKQTEVAFVPFFLAGIALDRDKFQEDGAHPTAQAQPILLDSVWPALQPLLESSAKRE